MCLIYSKPVLQYRQVALSLYAIHVYRVVRSSDRPWGFVPKKTFDRGSLSNEETRYLKKELDEIE